MLARDPVLRHRESYVIDVVRQRAASWTRRLLWASSQRYLQEVAAVERDCSRVHVLLKSQEPPLQACTATLAATEVLAIVAQYDRSRLCMTQADVSAHISICHRMLAAVCLPCIKHWSILRHSSKYLQESLVRTLPSVRHVTTLSVAARVDCLAKYINLLSHLQEFYFPIHCNNEVLAELGSHCCQLRRLSVMCSLQVDDDCVEAVQKLVRLQFLNVEGTCLTADGYRELLSGLPTVQSVTWDGPVDEVLPRDGGVTRIEGMAPLDALQLPLLCQYVTHLSLKGGANCLSALSQLAVVQELILDDCDADVVRLDALLTGLGRSLTTLELRHVSGTNLSHLGPCLALQTLILASCQLRADDVTPELRNLEVLELDANTCKGLQLWLGRLPNLKVLRAHKTPELEDTTVVEALQSGGFRELRDFGAWNCGDMTCVTAFVLTQNCRQLSDMRGLGSWPGVQREDVECLLHLVQRSGLAVRLHM